MDNDIKKVWSSLPHTPAALDKKKYERREIIFLQNRKYVEEKHLVEFDNSERNRWEENEKGGRETELEFLKNIGTQ
jgi:hypothetical protein